ncbi:MAG: hypothetical protein ACT6Q8_12160 [Niveispirillum sp.]|uniref:hypothetical protein n=1 Tax=Niveispirillum sp. TaxID=1917217 RepID=UPI004035C316
MSFHKRDLLGSKSTGTIAEYLREIGDDEAADRMVAKGGSGQGMGSFWGQDVWGYTGLLIGFIAPDAKGTNISIMNAMTLEPDNTLKNTRVKITLDRFWVHRYPGMGKHTILCEFTGKNQIRGEAEELRFALTTEAKDGSSASVSGSPIFLGVSVGQNGISFEGRTINVRSDKDEVLLTALGSGPFRDGLSLLTTAQPALKPFVGLAGSLVTSVLSRSRNEPVYCFKMGLDFEKSTTSAKLRYGSFVVIQGDDSKWSWEDVVWNADAQQLVRKHDRSTLEYNYLVFRVSAYNEPG